MERRVEGIYPNVEEALRAVDRLREQGYSRENITLVANDEVRRTFGSDVDADVSTQDIDQDRSMDRVDEGDEDRSVWESIKDFFTMDDTYDDPNYDVENDPLYAHRSVITQGKIAVLVTGEPTMDVGMDRTDTTDTMDMGTPVTDTDRTRDDVDDETIELREERLKVDKEKEKTGEVHVSKKVVEDTEIVEVPVTKEEVTIERKPVTGDKTSDGEIEITDDEEIVIPVEEEKVKPKKETDVVEEVEIKKETKQDSQTVGDTVRHEELEVEEDGDVLDSRDKNVDNPDDDKLDREISNDRFGDDDRRNNR
ncbi:DUF2382 domain-containing protein [Carnobacteriaceae bacterium 52-44]